MSERIKEWLLYALAVAIGMPIGMVIGFVLATAFLTLVEWVAV